MHQDFFGNIAGTETEVNDRWSCAIPWEVGGVSGFVVQGEVVVFHPIGNGL
jgi:hypothetical protein